MDVGCDYAACVVFRVGQNHIYTVYIRYFWQENHQIYGVYIRFWPTLVVLYAVCSLWPALLVQAPRCTKRLEAVDVGCDYAACVVFRVGQNHIYTVYIRYFWQGNHQIYGVYIRFWPTLVVLYAVCSLWPALLVQAPRCTKRLEAVDVLNKQRKATT